MFGKSSKSRRDAIRPTDKLLKPPQGGGILHEKSGFGLDKTKGTLGLERDCGFRFRICVNLRHLRVRSRKPTNHECKSHPAN
jgi:hypothetical protein